VRVVEKSQMDSPNWERWSGSTAPTPEVVRSSSLFTGSDFWNLAPNLVMSIALLIDSWSEGKRSVGSCGRIERGKLCMRSWTLVGAFLKTWNGWSPTRKL